MLHWAVYFIVISVFFSQLGTIYIAGLTLNQLVIVFLLYIELFRRFLKKEKIYKIESLDIILIIYAAYLWFSNYIISQNPEWGSYACMTNLRSLTCYFLVVVLITNITKIRLFVASFMIASIAMLLTANIFSTITSGVEFSYEGREGLTGLAGHYINYARYALISVPFAYFALKICSKPLKPIITIIIISLSAGGLFSGSRGAIITFIIILISTFFVEFYIADNFSFKRLIFVLFIGIGIFAIYLSKGGSGFIFSLMSPIVGGPEDASLVGRIYIMKKAFNLFLTAPIFGVGIDSARHLAFMVPHDQWLQIISELGLIGLIITLTIVYHIFKTLIYSYNLAKKQNDLIIINLIFGLGVTLFSIFFWGLYENYGLIGYSKLPYMLFGLSKSIKAVIESKTISTKQD